MFWSEFRAGIAASLAAIFSGMIFRLLDFVNKQREFVAILIALKNECRFNLSGRGNSQSPFRIYWLEKALSNLNLHEQCDDIAKKGLKVFELVQDANIDQLKYRKHSNGVSMVPSTVQNKMLEIADEIDLVLPDLQKRAKVMGYLLWRFNLLCSFLVN